MSFTCRKTKAKNTHSEYVILIALPRQQWLCERASILCYAYNDCVFCKRDGLRLLRGTDWILYRVSQEECARLREGVPYVKVYRLTQNTHVQSWTVTEIMAREKCGLLAGPRTVPVSWQSYPCPSLSVVSYYGNSAHACSKLLMYFLLGDKAVQVSAWHSCHV